MEAMSLQEIGKRCGTDKAEQPHIFRGQTYLDIYERYFSKMRDWHISIIEIGVRNGASLRTWEQYFPNATVVGIDIDTACADLEFERAKVVIGHQTDLAVLCEAVEICGEPPMIIIDDGSHINELTIQTHRMFWPTLESGGLYILEDMATTYRHNIVSDMKRGGWLLPYVDEQNTHNRRADIEEYLWPMVHTLDAKLGDVRAMHLHCMTYILEAV